MPLTSVGNIYITSNPEFIGKFPVRQELTVLPADVVDVHEQIIITDDDQIYDAKQPQFTANRVIGFSVKETIGIGIINTKGVAAGKKSVVKE